MSQREPGFDDFFTFRASRSIETAYVFLTCDLGYEKTIIKELKRVDSISEVCGIYGTYDIIAKVEHSEIDKLRKIITWNIRKLEHVRSTLTLMKIQGQNQKINYD